MSEIKDISLAPEGEHKIDWVRKNCPLLRSLEEEFSQSLPFKGIRVALSIHLEAKPHICAKYWQPEALKCMLPAAILCPPRTMWQPRWQPQA